MPLTWLLPTVLFGVALVAVVIAWAGWFTDATVDEAIGRELFAEEFPGEPVVSALLATDGSAVLFELNQGFGVVFVVGDKRVIRRVSKDQVTQAEGCVRVDFRDFGAPALELRHA